MLTSARSGAGEEGCQQAKDIHTEAMTMRHADDFGLAKALKGNLQVNSVANKKCWRPLRLPKTTMEGFRRYNLCRSETCSHLSMWCFLKCKFTWTFIPSLVSSGTQAVCQLYQPFYLH